jgi:hypothetical protein
LENLHSMNLSDYYPSITATGAFKNKIINGAMNVWQRGTTFSGVGVGNTYSADRFVYSQSLAGGVVTLSRETNAPNQNFNYSLRATVTTADAAIVAGDSYRITQRIEGFNIVDLIGNTFTLSFWVRSPKTGTHCVSFVATGGTASYVSTYTVLSANTWEKKTITVPNGIDTSVGGPWNTTNGIGMAVRFALAAGSTFQTATTDAWIVGDFTATAAQVNCMDTIGNIFAITGVQLERGGTATEFEYLQQEADLALCQRYFLRTAAYGWAYAAAAVPIRVSTVYYPVTMRANPSIVFLTASGVNATGQTAESISNTHFGIATTALASGNVVWDGTLSVSAEI